MSETKNSEHGEILRGARVVGGFIVLSRILGFVRDSILAFYFGGKDVMDVFVVAFRIPNTFRQLFAEGSLTIAFVPVFTEKLKQGKQQEAKELFDTIFTLLTVILLAFSILGIVFAPAVVWLFAGGFSVHGDKFDLAVQCTRIVFPYILFISLVACCMGVLNSLRHFAAPAAAGMILNIDIIAGVMILPFFTDWPRIICASVGVFFGGIFQLIEQLPFLKKLGFFPKFRLNLKDPAVKRVMKLMIPSIFGAAVYQMNILVITRLASSLPSGSNAYLYYADRLFQLPLALFGIAIATSALPSLSRLVADKNQAEFSSTYGLALRSVMFVVLPAAVGLMVLRVGIVQTLFQAGSFTWLHTLETSRALLCFAIGLPALACVRVTVAAFNAHQDTATPVKTAIASLLTNIALSLWLRKYFAHSGLALAVTCASVFNFFLLNFLLRHKYGPMQGAAVLAAFLRMALLALAMGAVIYGLSEQINWAEGGRSVAKIVKLFGIIFLGVGFYFTAAKGLGFPEVATLGRGKK